MPQVVLDARYLFRIKYFRVAGTAGGDDACGGTACVGSEVMCRVIARLFTKRRKTAKRARIGGKTLKIKNY